MRQANVIGEPIEVPFHVQKDCCVIVPVGRPGKRSADPPIIDNLTVGAEPRPHANLQH